jgi:two-component system, OmpR family, sensor histidine kinase TctE
MAMSWRAKGVLPEAAAVASAAIDPPTHEPYSLFSEILDWILVPIMVIWPISFVTTFIIATDIAKRPHDQALANSVRVLVSQVRLINETPIAALPAQSQSILRADEVDTIYFRLTAEDGRLVAGDNELPAVAFDLERQERDTVYFTDALIQSEPIRIAYLVSTIRDGNTFVDVQAQVAETLNKRTKLAGAITGLVMTILFLLIPLVLFLVWFGLTRGLEPLATLKAKIQRRRPTDLSPIDPRDAPEELATLVSTINGQMARVAGQLKVQERFVADAAHQLRTPLAGLKTQAEIALVAHDSGDIRRRLEQMILSADDATHLIRQLLALARADDNELARAFESVDLNHIAREVALSWADEALRRRIDLGLETHAEPAMINGDVTLLRELISNLIDNAIKYSEDGGHVVVAVRRDNKAGRSIILEIEDGGIGIADTDRELVFERFYRVLGTGKTGSGLGLTIVRGIARRHNATIQLKTPATGQGTIVAVAFPAAPQELEPPRISTITL